MEKTGKPYSDEDHAAGSLQLRAAFAAFSRTKLFGARIKFFQRLYEGVERDTHRSRPNS